MPEFPTSPPVPTRKDVEQALSELDFPLSKEELVRCVQAQESDGDGAVIAQLKALPPATYASADEVLASVQLADQLG